MTITIRVIGAEVVQAKLERLDTSVRDFIRQKIFDLGIELRQLARTYAPVEHGTLSNSINARIVEDQDQIFAEVGPPIFYGRFFERGVDKEVIVHRKAMKEFQGVRMRQLAGGGVSIRARYRRIRPASKFTRHQYLPRRAFMQPALDQMRARIYTELTRTVKEVRFE